MDNTKIKYSSLRKEDYETIIENLSKQKKPLKCFFWEIIKLAIVFLFLALFGYSLENKGGDVWEFSSSFSSLNVIQKIILETIVWLALFFILLKVAGFINRKITYYKTDENIYAAIRELEKLSPALAFQEVLKTNNIMELQHEPREQSIIAKIQKKNGIYEKYTFISMQYYGKILKEEYIDFSWIDEEMEKILEKHNIVLPTVIKTEILL